MISSHDRTCQSTESNSVCSPMSIRSVCCGLISRTDLISRGKGEEKSSSWLASRARTLTRERVLSLDSQRPRQLQACSARPAGSRSLYVGDRSAVISYLLGHCLRVFSEQAKGRRGCLYRYSLLSQGIACSPIQYPSRRKCSACLMQFLANHFQAQRRCDHGSRTTLAFRPNGKFL